jgi:hypothetical protein
MSAFEQKGVNPHKEPGINENVSLMMQGLTGDSNTGYNYTGADIPFMSAMLQTESLLPVFSGHDHGDDWYVFPLFLWPIT